MLVTSKPVCEYESPNEIRYWSEQLSTVAVLEAELVVDVVLVDVVSVVLVLVDVLEVVLVLVELVLVELVLDVVDVLLALEVVLLVVLAVVVGPGRHWSVAKCKYWF